MSEQQEQQNPEQVQTRIGFEASLEAYNPNWKKELSNEQISLLRSFYQSAMRDLSLFIGAVNQANAQLVQAFQFMDNNAVNAKSEIPEVVVEAAVDPVVASKKPAKKPASKKNVK